PEDERIPLPKDPGTALLAGIFVLLALYTLYFAREIVMPIVFAFLLNLLLQPAMRLLAKLRIPKLVSAVLLLVLLFAVVIGLTTTLVGPASSWLDRLPQTLPRIEDKLFVLKLPLDHARQAIEELGKVTAPQGGSGATPVVV